MIAGLVIGPGTPGNRTDTGRRPVARPLRGQRRADGAGPFALRLLRQPACSQTRDGATGNATAQSWAPPVRSRCLREARTRRSSRRSRPAPTRPRCPAPAGRPASPSSRSTRSEPRPATARLVNLSTRGQVGTSGNIMIPGITIGPGAGTRTLLIRAAGPALASLGVPGALADPTLRWSRTRRAPRSASNDNWGTPVGNAPDASELSAAFTAAGAFSFAAGSLDSAAIASAGPGSYTVQVSGNGGSTGVALVEVYDITPAAPPGPGHRRHRRHGPERRHQRGQHGDVHRHADRRHERAAHGRLLGRRNRGERDRLRRAAGIRHHSRLRVRGDHHGRAQPQPLPGRHEHGRPDAQSLRSLHGRLRQRGDGHDPGHRPHPLHVADPPDIERHGLHRLRHRDNPAQRRRHPCKRQPFLQQPLVRRGRRPP